MNKLSKIFLVVIILLVIALGVVTYLYIDMRKVAENSKNDLLDLSNKMYEIRSQLYEKGLLNEIDI